MREQLPRRLAAVMFTDVVGYTAMMQEDEEAARVVRLRHREALEAAIAEHGGKLVQYLGDGSLSTFASTLGAVSAATEVQQTLRDEVPLRIGIHQGEIAFDEQGIYGDSVNVAARIMGLGTPGSVVVSDKAQAELENQRGLSTASLGQFHLKNVKRPPTVYAVDVDGLAVPTRDDVLALSESTALYKGVTEYWPKVAAGSVGVTIALGLALGDFLLQPAFQSYVVAWAATTAGLWFLFDRAEVAISPASRKQVGAWLSLADSGPSIRSIPHHFAILFDRVFGEKHLSLRCFMASAVASFVSVVVVMATWIGVAWPKQGVALFMGEEALYSGLYDVSISALVMEGWAVLVLAMVFNLLPDFVSLLETRVVLRWMARGRALGRWLILDLALTTVVSLSLMSAVARVAFFDPMPEETPTSVTKVLTDIVGFAPQVGRLQIPVLTLMPRDSVALLPPSSPTGADLRLPAAQRRLPVGAWDASLATFQRSGPLASLTERGFPLSVFFYSAFFTSAWLWLYAGSVILSRVLLRMNSGFGFLLRVTDVERHPFRSMGFVSVIIVSTLFAAGLPFVVL